MTRMIVMVAMKINTILLLVMTILPVRDGDGGDFDINDNPDDHLRDDQ